MDLPRLFQPPSSSFFLFGPRGTGKTTLLRDTLPAAFTINLLDGGTLRRLSGRPELLREMIMAAGDVRDVIVDEVQRAPELLHTIHDLIEDPATRHLRFVLTGSSARKLRRGGVDLLAGRALVTSLHPFMAAELPHFSLDEALELGLVPLIRCANDPAAALNAYVSVYLDQEVKAEGLVRSVGDFSRFLEAVSFSHGSIINLANVAREAEVSRNTVIGYLSILEDLLLAHRVPVFTRRAQRELAAHPKFYLFDAGVFRALRPKGPLDRASEMEGPALEGLVVQHIRAWIAYQNADAKLFYWRTRSGLEVDLVIYGAEGFWAVEVKNSRRIRPEDLRGLRAFAADYPECKPVLLYRGPDRLLTDGILCLPVEEFLVELRPGEPFVR